MTDDRRCVAALTAIALLLAMPGLADDHAVYRFKQVQTVLGPCCGDMGLDLGIDDEGSVLVAGRRGGLDFDCDGSVDLDTYGTPDSLITPG